VRTGAAGYPFIALPAFLLLAGCFGIPAATDPLPSPSVAPAPASAVTVSTVTPSAVTVVACTESGADPKDPKAREAVCLKELGKRASRKGNILSLKIDNGTVKTFRTDTKGCEGDGDKCEEYRLVGFYSAVGFYLVRAVGDDGYGFTLVNIRTGETREAGGLPRMSPDNSIFFSKNCEIDCWIHIDSMASSGPPVWQMMMGESPDGDNWEFVRWIDNDQVALHNAGQNQHCWPGNCEAILKRTGDSWKLETLK
jgi:hypothetical protein